MTRLRTFQLILLVCSWNVVNSKSNSQSNGNSTKGVIRHQQTFETKLNHLVVDVIGNRPTRLQPSSLSSSQHIKDEGD
ncbi:unnamed protein product [Chironomus riparius]|uniref:Uncharacterized protein n=1 Tax=Chironomus riparius TaxID=315576 RepID=A0A9N9S867_9DIPT|nr:unnamed protein product [Chironomus riparius]